MSNEKRELCRRELESYTPILRIYKHFMKLYLESDLLLTERESWFLLTQPRSLYWPIVSLLHFSDGVHCARNFLLSAWDSSPYHKHFTKLWAGHILARPGGVFWIQAPHRVSAKLGRHGVLGFADITRERRQMFPVKVGRAALSSKRLWSVPCWVHMTHMWLTQTSTWFPYYN